MKVSFVKDRSQIGLIDYLLVGAGSSLAVYSAGMSISEPSISAFCVSLVVLGTVVSFLVRVLLGRTAVVTADGVVYAGAVVASIFLLGQLNSILPQSGYPREMLLASALSWMLILGSFCTWRDGTLLFQAIPAIALFGLVGCYDTFRGVVYAFFGFLLCLATLFARAHTREMLQQAMDSGWFNRADGPGRSRAVRSSMAHYERIKEGPWRWLAGPEWALASALAVIFVSMWGAPVIRESVKDVSGSIKLPPPPVKTIIPPVIGKVATSEARIGQGPMAPLSDTPLYEAQMDRLRYLRGAVYDIYNGDGWRSSNGNQTGPFGTLIATGDSQEDASKSEIRKPKSFRWSIRPVAPVNLIPAPGEVTELTDDQRSCLVNRRQMSDGDVKGTVQGISIESDPSVNPTMAVAQLPTNLLETTSLAGVPESVKQIARDATLGAKNDYERAEAIEKEIDRRVRYNLKAPAVPSGRDPVEFFLLDSHEGYCDLFASSMVLMARSVGIPARYVTGFLPDADRAKDGTYVVVDADAHAWAELFFQDVGWVVFDATAGAAEVPEAGRGAATVGPPWYQSPWAQTSLNVLIVLVVGAGLLIVRRSLNPVRDASFVRRQLGRHYSRFVTLLEQKARVRRRVSATPDEFLALVLPSLNGAGEPAKELNRRFVRAFYSPETIDESELATIKQELRRFAGQVRKG